MSRFAVASKALRGPFTKLIHKLEITLRKPVVRRCGSIGRRIEAHFKATDTRTALQAARRQAGVRSLGPRPIPVSTSVAVDRRTGRVVGSGHARDNPQIPSQLRAALPEVSLERWPVTNCAEVSAASEAIEGGSRLEDLIIRTVRTKEDVDFPPCRNCKTWLPGED